MDLTSSALERLRASGRQPSLSAAAAVDGRIIWADAVGDADPLGELRTPTSTTRYRVASITKPQVAVAVLALVEAGEVGLDRPMASWLPDAPAAEASVRQFLAHTSGLPAEPTGPWWERAGGHSWDDLVAMRLPLLAAPGTRFHYSNVGYAVLGRLLESVHGRPWDAVLADVLWRPLGMAETSLDPGADRAVGVAVHPSENLVHPEPVAEYLAMAPAGALWSTPSDLVRFGSFLAGVGGGLGVLRPEILSLMRAPIAFADVAGEPWSEGYGLGIAVENVAGARLFGHTGSVPGFSARLAFDPDAGVAVAACGNATERFGSVEPLLDAARALSPRADWSAPPAHEVGELLGTWFWGPKEYALTVSSGLLVLEASGAERHPFAPDGDGWVGVGGDYFHRERLRLVRSASGGVRQLDVGTFCFTRTPYAPDANLPGGMGGGWRSRHP